MKKVLFLAAVALISIIAIPPDVAKAGWLEDIGDFLAKHWKPIPHPITFVNLSAEGVVHVRLDTNRESFDVGPGESNTFVKPNVGDAPSIFVEKNGQVIASFNFPVFTSLHTKLIWKGGDQFIDE